MHDDSDVIQASTPGTIRLPRLWANSKEMKTDTYSDRCSTTCRNDSTMSTAAQPLIHAHMCTTRPPPKAGHKSGHSPIQRTISYSERRVTSPKLPTHRSSSVTTPDHASQQPTLDSATRSCTKRRRHQVQPRQRRESWLPYVMHWATAPRRSSNQTRNQRHRRLFFYLDRASYTPKHHGHTFYFSARPAPSPLSNGPVFLFSRLLLLTTSPFTKIPR